MMQKETLDLVFSFLGGRHAISKGGLNMQPVAERTFVLLYCPHMYGAVALKLPKGEVTHSVGASLDISRLICVPYAAVSAFLSANEAWQHVAIPY